MQEEEKLGISEEAVALEETSEQSTADRVRVISPIRLVFKRFFRSRLCIVGLVMFVLLFLFSFLGPVFIPWAEDQVDRSGADPVYSYRRIEVEIDGEKFTVYADEISNSETNIHAEPFTYGKGDTPWLHVLGTDENGRDIFVRLI